MNGEGIKREAGESGGWDDLREVEFRGDGAGDERGEAELEDARVEGEFADDDAQDEGEFAEDGDEDMQVEGKFAIDDKEREFLEKLAREEEERVKANLTRKEKLSPAEYAGILDYAEKHNLTLDREVAERCLECFGEMRGYGVRMILDAREALEKAGVTPFEIAMTIKKEGEGLFVYEEEIKEAGLDVTRGVVDGEEVEMELDFDKLAKNALWKALETGQFDDVVMHLSGYGRHGYTREEIAKLVFGAGDARSVEWLAGKMGREHKEVEDLLAQRRAMVIPEFRDHCPEWETEGPEAAEEHRELFRQLTEKKVRRGMSEELRVFKGKKWNKLDEQGKVEAARNLAGKLAESYGLEFPFEVAVEDLNVQWDWQPEKRAERGGQCRGFWMKAEEKEGLAEKLKAAGIDTEWVRGSRIEMDRESIEDGWFAAGLVAHEMWHAFQNQQAFLYAKGYFGKVPGNGEDEERSDVTVGEEVEDGGGVVEGVEGIAGVEEVEAVAGGAGRRARPFRETPELAKCYAMAKQRGSYAVIDDDFRAYRRQILESEAYEIGQYYENVIKAVEDAPLADENIIWTMKGIVKKLRGKK